MEGIRVSILCGAALAIVNFAKVMLIDGLLLGNAEINAVVALVVCLTLVIAVFIAKVIGCTLPILAKTIGFDPCCNGEPVYYHHRRRHHAFGVLPYCPGAASHLITAGLNCISDRRRSIYCPAFFVAALLQLRLQLIFFDRATPTK